MRDRGEALGELRVPSLGGDLYVSAVPLGSMDGLLLQLRPPAGARPQREPRLRIHALGRMQLEIGDRPLEGDWLDHRPGQVLKYLVCRRRRAVGEDPDSSWPS